MLAKLQNSGRTNRQATNNIHHGDDPFTATDLALNPVVTRMCFYRCVFLGFPESVVAAALARIGWKILHLDRYGSIERIDPK